MPIILASAIPIWKKRSGFSSMNFSIFKDPIKSAQSATTFGFVLPNSAKPAPKPLLVSFFSVYVYVFIFLIGLIINNLLKFQDLVLNLWQVVRRLVLYHAKHVYASCNLLRSPSLLLKAHKLAFRFL